MTAFLALSLAHCANGHPFAGANLRVKGNRRYCRSCELIKTRRKRGLPAPTYREIGKYFAAADLTALIDRATDGGTG